MNYQYIQQINNLDYMGLVNMLLTQITPEIRSTVLERLTELNDQLLNNLNNNTGNYNTINNDLARSGSLNTRKKDIIESLHPSLDQYRNMNINNNNITLQNPIPLGIPISSTNQFNNNHLNTNSYINTNYNNTKSQTKKIINEFSLDDIIDDVNEDNESLDEKLSKIKFLHGKILHEKKQRRKERELSVKKN